MNANMGKAFFSTVCFMLLLLLPAVSLADYEAGLKAMERGDLATAFAQWVLAAEQNDARAQYRLGSMFDKGEGVEQDYGEARKWYRLAAEQQYAEAEYSLGLLYYFGLGTQQNYAEATRLFRLAIQHGKEDALYLLGLSGRQCDYP